MKQEKHIKPASGFLFLLFELGLLGGAIGSFVVTGTAENKIPFIIMGSLSTLLFGLLMNGFFIVSPNESKVLTLFGTYVGTVRENGFYFTNPFYSKEVISLRAANFQSEKVKVNDQVGNPVELGIVVIWKVEDTFQAAFGVDNYKDFVRVQCESTMRHIAGKYPYDHFTDDQSEITLRAASDQVNKELMAELEERLSLAGLRILDTSIYHLAYAQEIAHAMLQRQQASAMVAARFKIVEGAVGMVEMALQELSKKEIVVLDDDKKAAMVSNLMVVLCGDSRVSPVLNTGTLHH